MCGRLSAVARLRRCLFLPKTVTGICAHRAPGGHGCRGSERNQMKKTAVIIAGTLAVLVVVATTLHLLVSRDAIRRQLEAVLTATFETPVSIGKLDVSTLPDALLSARQITFARRDQAPNLSVAAVHVDVSMSQIWRGEVVISELRLEDVTGGLEGLLEYIGRMSEASDDPPPVDMALRRIVASPVRLLTRQGRRLGPYEIAIQFGLEGELVAVSIARLDTLVRLNMARGEPGSVNFGFTARDWRVPYGPPLVFDRVDAVGRWLKDQGELEVQDLRMGAYGGAVAGQVRLGWGEEWLLKGQVLVEGVDTGAFLRALGRPGLTGALDWDGAFELRAPELALLLRSPELAGDFTLRNGSLRASRKAGGRAARRPALPFETLEGQIRYKPGRLELRRLQLHAPSLSRRRLGPYHVKMRMKDGGGLRSASLRREDDRVKLMIKSVGDGLEVEFGARRWTVPAGPPIRIDRLDLSGRLAEDDHLEVERIEAKLYGGKVEGKGTFSWENRLKLDLKGRVSDVDLEPLLTALGKPVMAGRFDATGETRLVAARASRLFERPVMYCDFSVRDGAIYEMDLQRAAQNLSDDYVTGGETRFDKLSGRLYLEKGMLTADDMKLTSTAFEAKGELAVDPRDELQGEIDVGLRQVSTLVGIPVQVSGTVQEPRLRPTNAAIAGAAAGTAVLGPGLGTALGIKAGQAVKKLSDFLGRNASETPPEGF